MEAAPHPKDTIQYLAVKDGMEQVHEYSFSDSCIPYSVDSEEDDRYSSVPGRRHSQDRSDTSDGKEGGEDDVHFQVSSSDLTSIVCDQRISALVAASQPTVPRSLVQGVPVNGSGLFPPPPAGYGDGEGGDNGEDHMYSVPNRTHSNSMLSSLASSEAHSQSTHSVHGSYWRVAAILIWVVFLAILYILEVITDVAVMVVLGREGLWVECAICLCLVLIPAVGVSILSLGLYKRDDSYYLALDVQYKKRTNLLSIVMHGLLLGPIHRYYKVGVVSPLYHTQFYKHIKRDTDLTRYILTMLHTLPQLSLYFHLMLTFQAAGREIPVLITVSAILSALSALLVIGSFSTNDLLSTRDVPQTWAAKGAVFLWHSTTCIARIVAFGSFSAQFGAYVFAPLVVHCLFMWIWVISQRPVLGDETDSNSKRDSENENGNPDKPLFTRIAIKVFWIYYYSLTGLVQLFVFYNIKGGRTRLRLLFYCSLTFVENMVFVLFYHFWRASWPSPLVVTVEVCVFALSITFMLAYYLVWHPRNTKDWSSSTLGIPPFCLCNHGNKYLKNAQRTLDAESHDNIALGQIQVSDCYSRPRIRNRFESPTPANMYEEPVDAANMYEEPVDGLVHHDFSHYLAQMSITTASVDRTTATNDRTSASYEHLEDTTASLDDLGGNTTSLEGLGGNTASLEGLGGNTTSLEGLGGNTTSLEGLGGNTTSLEGLGENNTSLEGLGGNTTSLEGLGGNTFGFERLGGHTTSLEGLCGHTTSLHEFKDISIGTDHLSGTSSPNHPQSLPPPPYSREEISVSMETVDTVEVLV
jgi:hypothetical protein